MFMGAVLVGCSFDVAGVIRWLWEQCYWECSYWWGWCDQMVMGAVLVGV